MEGGEELFLRTRDFVYARNFLERLGDSLQSLVDLPYVPDSPLTGENAQKAGFKPKISLDQGIRELITLFKNVDVKFVNNY